VTATNSLGEASCSADMIVEGKCLTDTCYYIVRVSYCIYITFLKLCFIYYL